MKTDDPVILRRLEEIEAACAGLRMACGFPDPHSPTSRREGQTAITIDQGAALVDREWDNYPDKAILHDELTDRGLRPEEADAILSRRDLQRHFAAEHATEGAPT